MKLTPKQLAGLRYYDPEDEYVTASPHASTRTSLEIKGLIEVKESGKFGLTVRGKRYIRDYVAASGNGPEDLKARFSFLR